MRKLSLLAAVLLALVLVVPAYAAPLFSDLPEHHWALDAVTQLASKGIVEGYPDGTFKGDRAATRWEVALMVARLMARMDQQDATFATKADLDQLRGLVNELRSELDALGVRVTNLEENVGKLGTRVTALEKITFYGSLDTYFVSQGFKNTGRDTDAAGFSYNNTTGSAGGAWGAGAGVYGANANPFGVTLNGAGPAVQNPFGFVLGNDGHKFPVIDYFTGTPLTNGTGFSGLGILGTKIKVSDDISAGGEFAAFMSQGDSIVDLWYGASANYLANGFTGENQLFGPQFQTNTPFTRMTLDNFWIVHNPSGTRVVLGAYTKTNMDKFILNNVPNPNVNGPAMLPWYGFQVTGSSNLLAPFTWELLGTKLPDSAFNNAGGYYNFALAFDLDWAFNGGDFKLNFLRAANDNFFGGGNVSSGGIVFNNFPLFGGWINPSGYFAGTQTESYKQPITPAFGGVGLQIQPDGAVGNFGPQGITTYGASLHYTFSIPWQLMFTGEYASSQYKPNMNSGYTTSGAAFRAGLNATLANEMLKLGLDYVSVDPNYDPFILEYPNSTAIGYGFWRLPSLSYPSNLYSLHDTEVYPQNRQGWKFDFDYKFSSGDGRFFGHYQNLDQKTASVPDVASFPAGTAGIYFPGIVGPGFSPGFVEAIFPALLMNPVYGNALAGTTFTALEAPKGNIVNWGLGVDYKFPNTKLGIELGYRDWKFKRTSGLANQIPAFGIFISNPNVVDLDINQGHIGLSYPLNDRFTLYGGYDFANIKGAYQSAVTNLDTRQNVPYLGFGYNISENTTWNLNLKAYNTTDGISTDPNDGFLNGPFSWNGSQVSTELKVSF